MDDNKIEMSYDDMIFIWPLYHNDIHTGIYKIGITSKRLGKKRINQVLRSLNNLPELIGIYSTKDKETILIPTENALEIENYLHKTYTNIPDGIPDDVDGKTEFRVLYDQDIEEIRQYLENINYL